MSGSTAAIIAIPIVAFFALGVMLGLVMWASREPAGKDHGVRPRWDVSGGTFRGDPRQQTPRRDAAPPEAEKYEPASQPERR